MTISFISPSASGSLIVPDTLTPFFLWLAAHREDQTAHSLLVLIAELEREIDAEERANIRRTIAELLGETP